MSVVTSYSKLGALGCHKMACFKVLTWCCFLKYTAWGKTGGRLLLCLLIQKKLWSQWWFQNQLCLCVQKSVSLMVIILKGFGFHMSAPHYQYFHHFCAKKKTLMSGCPWIWLSICVQAALYWQLNVTKWACGGKSGLRGLKILSKTFEELPCLFITIKKRLYRKCSHHIQASY